MTGSEDAERRVHRPVLSPLRYPGGKRRLAPFVAAALRDNDLRPDLLVEPFAGGASVALELLATDGVGRVALADSDPMVAAFWRTVFMDDGGAEWLCRRVASVSLDLKTWRRMKHTRWTTQRNLAFAGLYLNRTSFNGSLYRSAGPIGGQTQAGTYRLDARFNRSNIIKRIRACAELSDRVVSVTCDDAMRVVKATRSAAAAEGWSTFTYLDPPFWAKAQYLYSRWFSDLEHEELAEQLKFLKQPWLLSYDPAPEIVALFAEHPGVQVADVELFYGGSSRAGGSEIVVTNLTHLPRQTRMYRTNAERAVSGRERADLSEAAVTLAASTSGG